MISLSFAGPLRLNEDLELNDLLERFGDPTLDTRVQRHFRSQFRATGLRALVQKFSRNTRAAVVTWWPDHADTDVPGLMHLRWRSFYYKGAVGKTHSPLGFEPLVALTSPNIKDAQRAWEILDLIHSFPAPKTTGSAHDILAQSALWKDHCDSFKK